MSDKKNVSELIEMAYDKKQGGVTAWYFQIPDEVKPFIEGIEILIKQGKKPNSTAVSRILSEEYNFSVSRAGVNRWLTYLKEENEKERGSETS